MTPVILTNAGQYFDFTKPFDHDYRIEEIAHALSNLCRYTGHVESFYSVAQHSVLASLIVPPEYAFDALMHDSAEAYLGDVSSPLKRLLPEYKRIEGEVELAITHEFDLSFPMPAAVKHADLVMLLTEKRDLLPDHDPSPEFSWPAYEGLAPLEETIVPLSPLASREWFLQRYYELCAAR